MATIVQVERAIAFLSKGLYERMQRPRWPIGPIQNNYIFVWIAVLKLRFVVHVE